MQADDQLAEWLFRWEEAVLATLTVAAIMGPGDGKMLAQHHAHLDRHADCLRRERNGASG